MHTPTRGASRGRQVTAAVIGNALEWYDFIVYGFLASIIARLFFPSDNEYASLLMALATFGVGFFMRPVGGVLLGLYADRKGRKAAMQLIILLMTLSIALIAFAPDYAAIGLRAAADRGRADDPGLRHGRRVRQRHGLPGGVRAGPSPWPVWLLAAVRPVPGGVRRLRDGRARHPQPLARGAGQLGWRLPFVVGLLIGPVGLWMRRNMEETEAFLESPPGCG